MGNSICLSKKLVVSDITDLPADRTATELQVLDENEEMCALIKLSFPKVDDAVISGDQIFKKEYHGNEWYIFMPPKTYKFYIKYPGFEDLEVDLSQKFPKGVESGKTYKITIPYEASEVAPVVTKSEYQTSNNSISSSKTSNYQNTLTYSNYTKQIEKDILINKNCIYGHVGYNVVGLSGLCIGGGGYMSSINIEANYLLGISKSDDIYWNDSSGDIMPLLATYSPMGFNIIVGYGIRLGDRFRLTPRVGVQYAVLNEKSDKKIADKANALSLPIGLKLDFAIINHFGISVEPAYIVNISKSEGYKALSDISNKIKGYSDGFGLNISLFCNF